MLYLILLINPTPPKNSPWYKGQKVPPLGLAYVAAALEKIGFPVEIIDDYLLEKPIEYVKQMVRRSDPQIVGITCSSVSYRGCIETARVVKELSPSCKVVVGGPHPSYLPESMLQHQEIDYVVIGEGERAIAELAINITKTEDDSAISAIPGIAFRHEGKIIRNEPKFISNLDQIPYPARHLLPMHLYDRMVEYLSARPADLMNVVRGCPYSCTYCEIQKLWGQACRSFSPRRVVEEIDHLINKYGSKGIYFIGDNFTVRKKQTVEICKLIKEQKLDIEWACDTRVDLVSRELLKEMKDAGCRTIWFGVESGSPRILEKIKKGITLQQAVHAFELCKEEGIQTACSIMLGIPGETGNDMKATFKFVKKLDPDWCRFNVFIAVPGSSLYEEVLQMGLYDRVEDFVAYVKTEDFNFESVVAIQRRFLKEFNRSPKRILRRIRRDGFLSILRKNLGLFSSNGRYAC
jgi:anaerobic magnesium-protoporphyrin IX monomethyl ester cyclase